MIMKKTLNIMNISDSLNELTRLNVKYNASVTNMKWGSYVDLSINSYDIFNLKLEKGMSD